MRGGARVGDSIGPDLEAQRLAEAIPGGLGVDVNSYFRGSGDGGAEGSFMVRKLFTNTFMFDDSVLVCVWIFVRFVWS
jgi:hypothetical protein